MNTADIENILALSPSVKLHYRGTFAADDYVIPMRNEVVIVNTSPSNKAGSHWVVLVNADKLYLFCPLATRPFSHLRPYYLMNCPLQSDKNNTCGVWAILFVLAVCNNNVKPFDGLIGLSAEECDIRAVSQLNEFVDSHKQ